MQTQVEKELGQIRKSLGELADIAKQFAKLYEKHERNVIKLTTATQSDCDDGSTYPTLEDSIVPISIHGQPLKTDNSIIAVDFDGTLCENKWPEIGEPILPMLAYIKKRKRHGARLILWTNRSGERLDEAVAWCAARGIAFNAVNENLPEIIQQFGSDCRKIYADEYIDDRAFNAIDLTAKLQDV